MTGNSSTNFLAEVWPILILKYYFIFSKAVLHSKKIANVKKLIFLIKSKFSFWFDFK